MNAVSRAVLCASLLILAPLSPAQAASPLDRNQLWLTVSFKCMRHLAKSEAPIPCDNVDTTLGWDHGVALLKADAGIARMLIVPTHPVSGAEEVAALGDAEPNYFAAGWTARLGFPLRLHALPPAGDVAVVAPARQEQDQDQFHLIVDCLDPAAAAALAEQANRVTASWAQGAVTLRGKPYWARRIEGDDAKSVQPLRRLADDLPGAKQDLASWSVALTQPASLGGKSFVLLADRHGEAQGPRLTDLLDPSCAIVQNR